MRTDELNEAREGELDNPFTVKFNVLTDESIGGVANTRDMQRQTGYEKLT